MFTTFQLYTTILRRTIEILYMNHGEIFQIVSLSFIKLVDNHYELPLPWNYEDQIMPNNKNKFSTFLEADIESMYYSLRFLWWPDGNLESQPVVHRMKVHLFGANSSPCCASFALRQAAIDFGAHFKPYISSAIEEHFYVDDFLISVSNVEIGLKLMKDIKHLLSKASFNLTKWCSNCLELIKHLA